MSSNNSFASYGSIAKSFHWLTALLIFSAFPLGYFANELAHEITGPDFDGSKDVIEQATLLFSIHKTVGVAMFFVGVLRIVWAVTQEKPGLLHPENKPEALAAETVHWVLYASLVLAPLSGWIHHAATVGYAPIWWPLGQNLPFIPKSDGLAEIFAGLHWIFVWTLLATVALHIAGALKHQIIDRDATLQRMLPGRRNLPQPPAQSHSLMPAVVALAVFAAVLTGGATTGVFQTHTAGNGDSDTQLAEVLSGWTVTEGVLGIEVTQMGGQVAGSFADWTAAITFDDPAAPGPAGDVEVIIAIPSLSLGTVTAQAMGADYFDSATYPTAVFKADIEKLEQGYQAVGTLTIRDKILPITLPFTLDLQDDAAKMKAELTLNRLDFDIGRSLPDESSLGFAVIVSIELDALRAK
ncbi:cytochrome b/b6 domain-containing protein [Parasedimentitalea maritima]|uniref:Cytochrome n=1 Tax=Parasedimentitalea maritima TaxID=2578117 RepID=A0A6A4RLI4_9RHOB|nr:cytochrome b/b6 domain-containing protein [Zongyanglinia marina]KAE9631618.1 cytochrome [Zongyanglinia marina]